MGESVRAYTALYTVSFFVHIVDATSMHIVWHGPLTERHAADALSPDTEL
jgi:hypothetical protein